MCRPDVRPGARRTGLAAADRRGARGVYATTPVAQALATAAFVLVDAFWPFVLAVCAATGAEAAGLAARSPLIRHHGGDRPQEFRALSAGWTVQVGTVTAYRLLVLGNAVAFAASAAILLFLPPAAPPPAVRWARREQRASDARAPRPESARAV
ncbi:hypothetical protein ACFWOG_34955 [Kitasatospora sp. NPDC058406]|uniref:hypothetical protein n=1 Tax=Kitasatospora sp. NPDC058406 TaxID=3346483 RepID=UPI003650DED1